MSSSFCISLTQVSDEPREALQFIVNILLSEIYPISTKIRRKLKCYINNSDNEDNLKLQDVYSLCCHQIKKIILNLIEIFKAENDHGLLLQDSRQFSIERMTWCINRLLTIDSCLDQPTKSSEGEESIFTTPVYFVNWIDHTFEVLAKLSEVIYKTDYKDDDELYQLWKDDIIECVTGLHTCVDELLVSAMTLCRYCLPCDQHIVKARCQVVLRETKVLISELVIENTNSIFKVTQDTLKLPVMPSNVNVMIDVLKDVLYVLETNTNTALLALLVHCFSYSKSPVDVLKEHFVSKETCKCGDDVEECSVVKEYDLYNERLLQIGSFAVSCSSDQTRILSLRSGLSSLEALDPHLVPAVMMSPSSHHASLLMNTWNQEVQEIKDNVFLIVDPAAFAEKAKTMMHPVLLELLNDKSYKNKSVCTVINIGCIVHDFFGVYKKHEPDALIQQNLLIPLLADLDKVQKECKIVSNLLASGDDFFYDVKQRNNNNNPSIEQLLKRLKLLYTVVSRINDLHHPKDSDDHLFELCEDENINATHTVHIINQNTYINTPRKPVNEVSRSIFARTPNVRSSTNNLPLSKLTKHFKVKKCEELSFSVKLDELVDAFDKNATENAPYVSTNLTRVRESSILYAYSPTKTRSSLRRTVLSSKLPYAKVIDKECNENTSNEKESLMDETMSLQITDVLNEIDNLTHILSPTKSNLTRKSEKQPEKKNILTLSINNQNLTISKHIWNIPVNASMEPLNDSERTNSSDVSQPSNVTTLERIEDLNRVESRLSSLRSIQFETSL